MTTAAVIGLIPRHRCRLEVALPHHDIRLIGKDKNIREIEAICGRVDHVFLMARHVPSELRRRIAPEKRCEVFGGFSDLIRKIKGRVPPEYNRAEKPAPIIEPVWEEVETPPVLALEVPPPVTAVANPEPDEVKSAATELDVTDAKELEVPKKEAQMKDIKGLAAGEVLRMKRPRSVEESRFWANIGVGRSTYLKKYGIRSEQRRTTDPYVVEVVVRHNPLLTPPVPKVEERPETVAESILRHLPEKDVATWLGLSQPAPVAEHEPAVEHEPVVEHEEEVVQEEEHVPPAEGDKPTLHAVPTPDNVRPFPVPSKSEGMEIDLPSGLIDAITGGVHQLASGARQEALRRGEAELWGMTVKAALDASGLMPVEVITERANAIADAFRRRFADA